MSKIKFRDKVKRARATYAREAYDRSQKLGSNFYKIATIERIAEKELRLKAIFTI